MFGPILGAVASISKSVAPALPFIGGIFDRKSAKSQARSANRQQQAALTHGIRWRVADAKAAGLHSLAVLGSNVSIPSPVRYGSNFRAMGQDLARAMAQPSPLEKAQARYLDAQTELIKGQTSKLRNPVNAPDMPQGYLEQDITQGDIKSTLNPAFQYYVDQGKYLWYSMHEKFSESAENDIMVRFKWAGVRAMDQLKNFIASHTKNPRLLQNLRDLRPIVPKGYEGYQVNWSIKRNMWKLVPEDGGKTILTDFPKMKQKRKSGWTYNKNWKNQMRNWFSEKQYEALYGKAPK